MNEERFRVNDLVKYDYSEIGEYIDENHTDRPLRNDILVKLLNELHEEKENWKNNCLNSVNENNILWNEIFILMEQGAEPSDAFKTYLNNLENKKQKIVR